MDGDILARVFYLVLILLALGGWAIAEYRGRMGFALRSALAWAAIFVAVMAGYALWGDIRTRMAPMQTVSEGGQIEVPRAEDGHYYLTLKVGDTPVHFLVDTGATNVVLTKEDARRLGFAPDELMYVGEAQTANGTVRSARVTLQDVTLGPVKDSRLIAWVNDGEMQDSLLGMDYLGLFHIEIARDTLILTR